MPDQVACAIAALQTMDKSTPSEEPSLERFPDLLTFITQRTRIVELDTTRFTSTITNADCVASEQEETQQVKELKKHKHRTLKASVTLNELRLEEKHFKRLQDVCAPLIIHDDKLKEVMRLINNHFEAGLNGDQDAVVRMLPSYVTAVPNGTETGNYLALDLGGTNFRVLLIRLNGKDAEMSGKIYRVPHEIMTGNGEMLFDHIADCMARFALDNNLTGKLPLGFTFSFPCQQHGLTHATLINWTKGFSATGVEGMDVVGMLKKAVDKRQDVKIDVVALLNDTVGTMMACAHQENSCNVGVIVGTGSNACYMERMSKIPKLQQEYPTSKADAEMCINTEWGAFGDDGCLAFIKTHFDKAVDDKSINKGRQTFEKMISGMYLGELVRVVLVELVEQGLLFGAQIGEMANVGRLRQHGAFPTKFVSEIENDLLQEERNFSNTFDILEDLGIEQVSMADCANVAYVCSLVSTRAAYLCAAGIAVLLIRIGKPFVTVGVDGSVYRFHPTFKSLLDDKIYSLISNDERGLEFQLMLSEDGSGKGAALVAAVACRLASESTTISSAFEGNTQTS